MKNKLLGKVGAVLDMICANSGAITLKELSEKLALPVPTLSRLCSDMVELGWLEKINYHHFVPGEAMLRFGTNAQRLYPYAASADSLIWEYCLRSGLNGMLYGYAKDAFFRVCSCALRSSDQNIMRRSGAFLALMSINGMSREKAKQVINYFYPDASEVELNNMDRELDVLQQQNLLVRAGAMRQWYITVPFAGKYAGYALTFYGSGPEKSNIETVCAEVTAISAKIRSAWTRLEER